MTAMLLPATCQAMRRRVVAGIRAACLEEQAPQKSGAMVSHHVDYIHIYIYIYIYIYIWEGGKLYRVYKRIMRRKWKLLFRF